VHPLHQDQYFKELKNGQVGVDLPRNKRIAYALTYIHGIGLTSAKKIIEIAGINPETSNDLTTEETITLRQALEDLDLKG
jgi:small subunit ribosomal protein S13